VRESYVALAPSTGLNPWANPDHWERVEAPDFLRQFVVHAAAAEDAREDEARYKERALAESELVSLRERLIEGQGQRRRAVR
jgi:hypothetical protein